MTRFIAGAIAGAATVLALIAADALTGALNTELDHIRSTP